MKITKFEHACLLVEMPTPVNRTALFDPGVMSEAALDIAKLEYLDDIFITHNHPDHYSPKLIEQLIEKFPSVRVTAPDEVGNALKEQGIGSSSQPPKGASYFSAPHENVRPLFPTPEQYGIHYLDMLSHPGDSHSFNETMPILALPIAGPWASLITGLNLAIKLKPRYILPIHDWHLSEPARQQMYELITKACNDENITFVPLKTGEPHIVEL